MLHFQFFLGFFIYKAQNHNKMKVPSIFEQKPRHSDDQWWAVKKPPVGPASASGNDISVIFSRIISILVFKITNHDGASAVLHSWFYVQSCVSAKYSVCFEMSTEHHSEQHFWHAGLLYGEQSLPVMFYSINPILVQYFYKPAIWTLMLTVLKFLQFVSLWIDAHGDP